MNMTTTMTIKDGGRVSRTGGESAQSAAFLRVFRVQSVDKFVDNISWPGRDFLFAKGG
jgi:hypothetical protein